MAGIDTDASQTADNYSVQLFFAYDCADADIEVRLTDFGAGNTTPGACLADLDPLPTGGLNIHHALMPFPAEPRILIDLNINLTWDTVFADGFEAGTSARWSVVIP